MGHVQIAELPQLPEAPTPHDVGVTQETLGRIWGDEYAYQRDEVTSQRAAIALANPAAFVRQGYVNRLPEDMRQEWSALLGESGQLARVADSRRVHGEETEWAPNTGALDQLHGLISRDRIFGYSRSDVGDIMTRASSLFARSVEAVPGNQPYYAENVGAMRSMLVGARAIRASRHN